MNIKIYKPNTKEYREAKEHATNTDRWYLVSRKVCKKYHYDPVLTITHAIIDHDSDEQGNLNAPLRYFGDILGRSPTTIRRALRRLENDGFLTILK